ncbi:MAG: alkaline phosphatase family protein, partial [Candidatus Acidiferrales bacterium]
MIRKNLRWLAAGVLACNLALISPAGLMAGQQGRNVREADRFHTDTPIKHVVVIFQENNSFDHYFGTYPNAANKSGETQFHARKDTPSVNGLTNGLLVHNPNGAYSPFRLDPSQNYTCDQNHDYTPE